MVTSISNWPFMGCPGSFYTLGQCTTEKSGMGSRVAFLCKGGKGYYAMGGREEPVAGKV